MKSKNVVLMVIAVGCGLAAAYVTAKLSAGGSSEMINVLVAADQLEQGAIIKSDEESQKKQLAIKQFPKGSEPASYIADPKQLAGKRLNKTLRKGDYFAETDLTNNQGWTLPKGRTGMAVKMSAETAVAGLVLPGCRVHVVLSECVNGSGNGGSGKRSAIIMKNMLVIAVNATVDRPVDKPTIDQPNTVTLAVTPKQGAQIALAQSRGSLSLLLLDNQNPIDKDELARADEVKPEDITFEPVTELPCDKKTEPLAVAPAGAQTVDLWVAKTDIPAGTKLEDVSVYLEKTQVTRVPENAVNDPDVLKGKTLSGPVYKNSFVPRSALEGKFEVAKAPDEAPRNLRPLTIFNGQSSATYTIDMNSKRILANGETGQPGKPRVEETPDESPAAPKSPPAKDSTSSDKESGSKAG